MARFVPKSKKLKTLRRLPLRPSTGDEKISSSSNNFENPTRSPKSPKKSSTENKGGPPKSPKSPTVVGEMGDLQGTPPISVDDSKKSKKFQSDEKFLTRETVAGKDGRHRAEIIVYKVGEVERVEGDKVVRRAGLKFVLKYGNVVKECVPTKDVAIDCSEATSEVAKASNYNISKKELVEAISELRERYGEEEAVPLVDYVRQKYPKELEAIEKDPFKWILEKTKHIVGYERLKLLTFLSIVSSQMERVMGMSRVHILLVGPSGAGKSSTIKIVTKFLEGFDIYIDGTRLTQNSLGYMDVKTFDGKVLFIEQIDRQVINYLREMMTEEKITTLVTEKVIDPETGRERFVTRRVVIPGQATVVSTSVVDTIDVDREQLFNRFLKVYVNPKSVDSKEVDRSIWTRRKIEISEVDKLVFLAYLLSRPKFAEVDDLFDRAEKFLESIRKVSREPTNRTTEILRNLVITTAIARGKTKADVEDFEFVMQHFQLDILYNGLGLSERDVEVIEALPDEGGLKTQEVADTLRGSKDYALKILKNLERKGVVEGIKEDNRTFTWYLTSLGKRIKALINGLESGVLEVKDGNGEVIVETKFRADDDGGGDRGNAVSSDVGRGVSKVEKEVDGGAQADDPEFVKYVKENNGAEKSFAEIVHDFGDKVKASKFLNWCIKTGQCEKVEIVRGQASIDHFRIRYRDELSGRIEKLYNDMLKGKIFSVREFFAVLGNDLAERILKWASERKLANRKVIDNEEFVEFL